MDSLQLEVLEQVLLHGGDGVPRNRIPSGGKYDKAIAELVEAGDLVKKRYHFLTTQGFERWASSRPEATVRSFQRQATAEFLSAVRSKDGKPLGKKDLATCIPQWREQAIQDGLVAVRGKAHALLPAGEEYLFASLPWIEQVEHLVEVHRELSQRVDALRVGVGQAMEDASAKAAEQLASVRGEVEAGLRASGERFDESIKKLAGLAVFATAAQTIRREVAELVTDCAVAEGPPVGMAQLATQSAAEVSRLDGELGRLEGLIRQLRHEGAPDRGPREAPDEEEVWAALRQAAFTHDRERPHLAGSLPIPEAHDEVAAKTGLSSRDAFHELLLKWSAENRVVLRVCDDISLEERAGEGIPSSRGTMFYIRVR